MKQHIHTTINGRKIIVDRNNTPIDQNINYLRHLVIEKYKRRSRIRFWSSLTLGIILFAGIIYTAYADTWVSPNNAGGQIVLTDRICKNYPHLLQMYTRVPTGATLNGCWALYDGLIHVVYDSGRQEFTYDPAGFIKQVSY